ncbi:hypothetical protein B9Z19DRAFT_1111094 [Tuber borchii]|uniref:Uncharacterized protein n=1 Tax=Tuber borchii TaxID=42251 RepID=A0A2T6ZDU7_TUBBO|nr:hypothetical protein B9Z19DRAFT_1111094 [Tuber borchii]
MKKEKKRQKKSNSASEFRNAKRENPINKSNNIGSSFCRTRLRRGFVHMLSPLHCADDDDGNGQIETGRQTEGILFSGDGGPIRISHFPSSHAGGRTDRLRGKKDELWHTMIPNVNMHFNQTSPRYEMCGLERNECEKRQRNKGGKRGEEEDRSTKP